MTSTSHVSKYTPKGPKNPILDTAEQARKAKATVLARNKKPKGNPSGILQELAEEGTGPNAVKNPR